MNQPKDKYLYRNADRFHEDKSKEAPPMPKLCVVCSGRGGVSRPPRAPLCP